MTCLLTENLRRLRFQIHSAFTLLTVSCYKFASNSSLSPSSILINLWGRAGYFGLFYCISSGKCEGKSFCWAHYFQFTSRFVKKEKTDARVQAHKVAVVFGYFSLPVSSCHKLTKQFSFPFFPLPFSWLCTIEAGSFALVIVHTVNGPLPLETGLVQSSPATPKPACFHKRHFPIVRVCRPWTVSQSVSQTKFETEREEKV